ncbi:unnamed protein product [Trichogramma brassicae]|uniref:Reverse transcriptase domain-containing protein n=1 Tax=Trichogramma brassicae TaxID=86971 RepID=A0A6H5J0X5_9HYME|nr:unnamed protein product [Trichogramma brassicae]
MPEEAPDNPFLDELFFFHEFNAALADEKDSSAPGMDGIGFDAIKRLLLKYKLLLLDIFNKMYSQATFPDSWREAFVIFIGKAKGSGLRPISLTSCFCNLVETLVRNRLQWWAETNNWLPRSQHGFRKGFSCSDNLTGLLLRAEEVLSTGRESRLLRGHTLLASPPELDIFFRTRCLVPSCECGSRFFRRWQVPNLLCRLHLLSVVLASGATL